MWIEQHGQFGKIIPPERIDLSNAGDFKQALQTLYEQGYSSIIVDCARLVIMDSAGLGSLVMFQKKLKNRGGGLKLVNVNHRYIKHLFDMIELGTIIDIEETGQ